MRTPGQRAVTQAEVESEIMYVNDKMETATEDFAVLAEEAAVAEHAYKVKKAVKNLEASTMPGNGKDGRTTVDEREAMVIRDCADELLAHLIAEAKYASAKVILRTQESRMDSLRTLSANIRAQT